MLNLSSIVINTASAQELKKFYTEAFGPEMPEPMGGWVVGKTYIGVLEHSEISGKNSGVSRIMFNLETDDVQGEFDRISQIEGAQIIKEPYQMEGWDGWIATLADPDGNYFQLMSPWEEDSSTN